MQLKKFSQAAQKVLINARSIAQKNHNLWVEPEHLALALMMTAELKELLSKKKVEHKEIEAALLKLIANLPVGVQAEPHFSHRLIQVLSAADALSLTKDHENIFVIDLFFSLIEHREKYGALGSIFGKYFLEEDDTIKVREKTPINEKNKSLFPANDNLTHLAKNGLIEPIVGREDEIERVIQVLSRKSGNNPLLIGEPGVGRSSIILALAERIVQQNVPTHLVGKEIVTFDVASLVSGATLRGQFEEKLRKLIADLAEQQGHYILFIRDLSLLMGAGGDGASDAANLLKPSLERGLIQIIGLVTPDAYKKRIESDPSFERFFQPIWVNAPTEQECGAILLGLKEKYEQFHGVFIEDDALYAAVELGARHLSGRVLPELALDIIDEACSRRRVHMDAKPQALKEAQARLMALEMEKEQGKKSSSKALEKLQASVKHITESYEKELSIIESMRSLKRELAQSALLLKKETTKGDVKKAATIAHKNMEQLLSELSKREKQLFAIKKSERFIDPFVKRDDIAAVISQETGILVQKMLQSEREKLKDMEALLSAHVIGQKEAITAVSHAIRRARVGLKDQKRPIGSFLFLGPTGVGKTELARTLTNFLFDDERALVRFDMSEFMERHSVARLIGAPPGYQGSEEGGQLTEKVRRKPYSVVLFDEIEKAHGDVLNVLLQVLDEGRLTDSKGHLVQFNNTVVIMTSNVGSDILLRDDPTSNVSARDLVMERLSTYLRPELINRIDEIVMFNPIDRDALLGIAELMLNNLEKRVKQEGFCLHVTQKVKDLLLKEGYSREFGARPLKRTIQRLLENPLAMTLIKGNFKKGDTIKANLTDTNEIAFSKG